MQAVILGFIMPVIPLLIWKLYNKEKQLTAMQAGGRYAVYILLCTLFTSIAMVVLCDEGTSFAEKMDRSPGFVLKYLFLQAVAAALISGAEWVWNTGKVKLAVDWQGYRNSLGGRICRRIVFPAALPALAVFVAGMNATLMNDNVVWGDEAYTCNAIRNGLDGIFQILTLQENHPPLHFLWLKGFAELFGYTVPVYHFASFVPFCVGLVLAVVWLRKRYGNIPAAFFVVISGLSAPCLEYNMEIRMYALAFLGMAGCYYCVGRILEGSRAAGWIGMVFWACVAAYSHYYALVAVSIMMAAACVAAYLRYRGRIWIKGVVSVAVFAAAYAPWLGQVLRATRHVSGSWWMTEIEGLQSSLTMIGCGAGMYRIILPLVVLFAGGLFLTESSLFRAKKEAGILTVHVTTPSAGKWSGETYTCAVGIVTIAGTLLFAYGISVFMRPLVTGRYLYPLCAVTAILLAAGSGRMLRRLEETGKACGRKWAAGAGKCVLVLILAVLVLQGMGNFKNYKALVKSEDAGTAQTLSIIGEPGEDTQFVSNGIQHIGWTVLDYYYQGADIVNGSFREATKDDVWYFSPGLLNEGDREIIEDMGYVITANYGEQQLGKYPFTLYRFERMQSAEPGK